MRVNEDALRTLKDCAPWNAAYEVQRDVVSWFHDACDHALGDACDLKPIRERDVSMDRNLFSILFVMATASLGLEDAKVRFYARLNQCLRALVTGCDNILDNEYKEVIPFDLPGDGVLFRSTLKIMTADAVIAGIAATEVAEGRFSVAQANRLCQSVLAVLIPSGVEEHEEESGIDGKVFVQPAPPLLDSTLPQQLRPATVLECAGEQIQEYYEDCDPNRKRSARRSYRVPIKSNEVNSEQCRTEYE